LQKVAAEVYTETEYLNKDIRHSGTFKDAELITIGYYSADFYSHATMHLIAELFENHDKSKFNIIAFSLGKNTNDIWQSRAKKSFNQYIDCSHMSDLEVVETSRRLGVEIAVDLKGHTQNSRTNIFMLNTAPIQVNYLGYPGTMGAKYIDYIVADKILIPENRRNDYSENIAYLPECYQPNCRERYVSDKSLNRADFGLPEKSIVFCSFNAQSKITPNLFNSWMNILKSVDGSVLWIMVKNSIAVNNLKKEAEKRGVDSSRLIFANYAPIEAHLSRLCLADLMLDTFPYGAHTTCSDALRMGLPVVTMMGESFASRVAGSLLTTIGLPELITYSLDEYERLAIRLAKNSSELATIKSILMENQKTSPLFDSERYARNIEKLYMKMVERHRQGLPPDHIQLDGNR
jgi:predicted O-linked N-acetylglucosamine transferase (SPINDLY family)